MSFKVQVMPNTASGNMNLKISDGRKSFYQWDKDVLLIASGLPVGCEIHFDYPGSDVPLTVVVKESGGKHFCEVPNVILMNSGTFGVYAYQTDADGSRTVYHRVFEVKPRKKPSDYVYTETETLSYASLEKRVDDLEGKVDLNSGGDVTMKDRATGAKHTVYVDDGKLMMEEV